MPETIATLAVKAGAWAANAAAAAGAPAAVQSLAAFAAYSATYVAAAAATATIASALAPDAPKPEQVKASKKQSRPSRVSGNGRARLGMSYCLFEAAANVSYDVGAIHDGLTHGPTGRYWLHDDECEIDGSGWVIGFDNKRYTPEHVKILTRNGLSTETAYAEVVSGLPSIWTNNHRGDGVASLALICNHADLKYQVEDFPNGLPTPSAEWDLSPVFDPRDPAQDWADPSTWSFTGPSGAQGQNPALCLLWYLCFAEGGPQMSYERRILPVVDTWIEAANVCDELVALKAGGTAPRYRMGGVWTWDSSPTSIIRNYLDTFDGWIMPDGRGRLPCFAGKYYAPGPDDVIRTATSYRLRRFDNDEDAVNEFEISFTSPDHAYNSVTTDSWRDETDILLRGVVRTDPLSLDWVQNHPQARRLAKRRMSQQNAPAKGTTRTYLDGLDLLGKRYLRIMLAEEVPTMRDIIVEVTGAEIDLAGLGVTFEWRKADELIDAWNPAAEEGNGVDEVPTVDPIYAPVPEIMDVVPFYDNVSGGTAGVRLQVITDQPVSDDLLYAVRYRRFGNVSYDVGAPQEEVAITGGSYVTTGFVPADDDIEVQVAAVTASGSYTEWSDTFTVNTSTENVAPGQPTDLSAVGAAGSATISWRNPTSLNLDHLQLYRGTSTSFGSATPIGSPIVGGVGEVMGVTDTVAAGTYRYWVQAFNANGDGSGPTGPATATVT